MKMWAFPVILLCLLTSCASVPDEALIDAAGEEKPAVSAAANLSDPGRGLDIRSLPDKAAVYLNNRYRGLTPLLLANLDRGRYHLRLEKEGYRTVSTWIHYNADYLHYEIELEEIAGTLRIEVTPPQAEISLAERIIPAGEAVTLPAGVYDLRIRAFGYEEQSAVVTISDRETTTLNIELRRVDFGISPLALNRKSFNPAAPGLLGRVTVNFRVTAPGTGQVAFLDASRRSLKTLALKEFTTWNQTFDWTGKDASGLPLPDGPYLIRVEARGSGGELETREASVMIDSSSHISCRSVWSGASGLLYAPTPELLAQGAVQVSSLAMVRLGAGDLRSPWITGLRLGLKQNAELDMHGGFIIGSEPSLDADERLWPVLAGAALKTALFDAGVHPRLEGAFLLKLAYQHARTDTPSSFTGISAGVPCALRLGSFLLVASPQLIFAPWSVDYDRTLTVDHPDYSLWVYGRAGLLYEARGWQLGLSAALRSSPLSANLKLDMPFQTGFELHRLLPGTQLFLTLALAAELGAGEDFYAGVGMGLID